MRSSAVEKQVSAFRELAKKIVSYGHTLAVLDWDMRVNGPSKGMESRAEMIGVISGEHFKLLTSKEMESFLAELGEPDTLASLDPVTRGSVLEYKKEFEKNQKIPIDRYQENVVLTSNLQPCGSKRVLKTTLPCSVLIWRRLLPCRSSLSTTGAKRATMSTIPC